MKFKNLKTVMALASMAVMLCATPVFAAEGSKTSNETSNIGTNTAPDDSTVTLTGEKEVTYTLVVPKTLNYGKADVEDSMTAKIWCKGSWASTDCLKVSTGKTVTIYKCSAVGTKVSPEKTESINVKLSAGSDDAGINLTSDTNNWMFTRAGQNMGELDPAYVNMKVDEEKKLDTMFGLWEGTIKYTAQIENLT